MSAVLSPCGRYRYQLRRELAPAGPTVAVIGVNPSTANAEVDDATIRKLRGFGARLGWGSFVVANLCAYRATDVRDLARAHDPSGPLADHHLYSVIQHADTVIAAWGPCAKLPKPLRGRWGTAVWLAQKAGKPLMCWGTAKDGQPRHPLMLAYDTPLVLWSPPL